jgi:hypothetical protein
VQIEHDREFTIPRIRIAESLSREDRSTAPATVFVRHSFGIRH